MTRAAPFVEGRAASAAPRLVYPFAALVGQDRLKTALLLNAVCPAVGGVLIRGEKGAAKSTAVRGLAALLPEVEAVDGCAFQCRPARPRCLACREQAESGRLRAVRRPTRMVDLPLGATEDRVSGCLDLEQAVIQGRKALQPGLLAEAHRGVLYVDEVNLLHDHLVDIILDAAAMGENVIERESVSVRHDAEFILVGTMNPEEGELRPQLLDRFGLCVDVAAPRTVGERVEVMRRRERFDRDPAGFLREYASAQEDLRRRILHAQSLLPDVAVSDAMRRLCCELCLEAHAAGHRGDIVMRLAARALAALDSRPEVSEADVRLAAEMALLHRVRNAPPPPPEQEQQQQQEQEQEHEPDQDQPEQQEQDHSAAPPEESREEQNQSEPEQQEDTESESQRPALESVFPVGDPFRVKSLSLARDRTPRKGSGKRTRSRTPLKAGRYVRSRPDSKPADLALDATLRAAAVHQKSRSRPGMAVAVEDEDLMRKVREKRVGGFIVFAVDASGSMGANRRMVETKGAVLSLLLDAYQKRDMVSFVAFRGEEAEMLLPPTNSVELAYRRLDELPTGGKTPLSAGLALARQTLENQLRKDPSAFPVLVLISDGRANASRFGGKPLAEAMDMARAVGDEGRIRSVVIDVEKPGLVNFGLAGELAEHMGGRCFKIEDLRAETLVDILRREILPG